MRKIFLVLLVIAAAAATLAVPSARASEGMEKAMMGIRSPEDIARFFSNELVYKLTLPDKVHSPEETIEAMAGDCEDLAILASAILTRMGVENQVLIIRFSGMKIAHAICIWKDRNGYYNFISNQELYRSGRRTINDAVMKFYPDCQTISSIDPKVYVNTGGECETVSAKSYHGSDLMTDLDPRWSASI